MALPLVAAGAFEAVIELTDIAFLARYGLTELAAVALGATLYEVAGCLLIGVADGIQILCARRKGQGRPAAVGRVLRRGLVWAAGTGLILLLALRFVGPSVMRSFVASPDVGAAAAAYLRVMAVAVVVHGLNLAWGAFYTGLGKTRVLAGGAMVLAATNIGLDYCLIFGNLGFPELGIRGAALASLAAEAATLAFFVAAAAFRGDVRRYRLLARSEAEPGLSARLRALSWPVAVEGLIGALRWFLFFLILERVGEEMLAWAGIVHAVYALLWIPLEGLSETTCTAVSQLIGRAEAGFRDLLGRLALLAFGLEAPILLLALAAPGWALMPLISDPQAIAACAPGVRVAAIVLLMAIPGEILLSAIAGLGETRVVLRIQFLVTPPALLYAFLSAQVWGQSIAVVWLFEAVVWALAGVAAAARLLRLEVPPQEVPPEYQQDRASSSRL